MTYPVKSPKKLIEVALPLDVINKASVRESYIYRGNPSSLHKWWAQRPLAAARAVIFSQLVNDPSWKWEMENPGSIPPGHLRASWAASRKRLFKIIEDLVQWENTNNEEVLQKARSEIFRSWHEVCELNKEHPKSSELFNPARLPAFHDPFAGGGTIPLEAQRLGLEAWASDLNPVSVLINKAMIEIPPKFVGMPPVNPEARKPENALGKAWIGAAGLAEDVRYYGDLIHKEARKRLDHLYPSVEITKEMAHERPDLRPLVGQKLNAIAWLWARTVKSPNPAFSHVHVPLATTFVLSSKKDKEMYVQPIVEGDHYHFTVNIGTSPEAKNGTKLARGVNFRCLMSDTAIEGDYIKTESCSGRMGARLMAVVAESVNGRVYLPPSEDIESIALQAKPQWKPDIVISGSTQYLGVKPYGMERFSQIFTNRQLEALSSFSDINMEVQDRILIDVLSAGIPDKGECLASDGTDATSYVESIMIYLAFILSKTLDYNCALVPWYTKEDRPGHLFSKQAIPMVWDYTEVNPLSEIGGAFSASIRIVADALSGCPKEGLPGHAKQLDAVNLCTNSMFIVSTDPPYYDNVPYADLSDFFYVWLRRSLRNIFPSLFATMAVPKAEELVAFAYRHKNGKVDAETFFLSGMSQAMQRLVEQAHPAFPITIYYAFKQSATDSEAETTNTGWVTFLDAVICTGFAINGTWPMRTERSTRSRGIGSNALASSIVLVCRKRPDDVPTISRREFLRELNTVLPQALDEMTKGADDDQSPVAPVDLSQAIIGPGMAVFSKYAAVLEADGSPMSVRTALQLINRFLAEDDFDADTQFCLHWFDQYGWDEGAYGEADVLARAKATSVGGLAESGVVHSGGGKVRLLRPNEYPVDWNPEKDMRLPIWEALHQLIRTLRQQGESGAGELLAAVKAKGEGVRQLAYRLYTLCERRGWAEDARAYNELITSWSGIESAASQASTQPRQGTLFNN